MSGPGAVTDRRFPHGGSSGQRRRRTLLVAGLAVAALVLAGVLTGPPTDGPALDPGSTSEDGLAGLLDLAESLGSDADIATKLPSDTSVHLLVVRDLLGPQGRDQVRAWVADGGRVVVTDPSSPLHGLTPTPAPVSDMVGPTARAPDCDVPALAEVSGVLHAAWSGYEVPETAVSCFGLSGDAAWLVARAHGRGEIVALGSPAPLVNGMLDREDNAVLAAGLLFADPQARVEVLPPDPAAQAEVVGQQPEGDAGVAVSDLLPAQLPLVLVATGLAIVALLLAHGRRLGRPVHERLPPTLPSAELARSVGALLQRSKSRQGAARRLREDARREVGRVLGVVDLDPAGLAEHARHRLALEPEIARRALLDLDVDDEDALVAVAQATAAVHERLRHPAQ